MEDNHRPFRHLQTAALFAVILVSISSSSLLVVLSGATAVSCAFWRVFLASLILGLTKLLRRRETGLQLDQRLFMYSIVSGILLAVHFLLWMESLFLIPIAVSTTVVVTYPLFSLLIDHFIFKEDIGTFQVLGLTAGFIGVLLFLHPQILTSYEYHGVLLAFGGALGATGYFSIGRFVRRKTDVLSYTFFTYASASISLLLYALLRNEDLWTYPPQTYTFFLLLAVVPMIGGHTLINYLLRYVKTSVATSIALGEPVGASILAHLLLQQQIDVPQALVMTLVLSSIALTISQEIKKGASVTR
ncbi:MAG: DMT family transporter [Candidatus Bathyarchaeota archaeon]|nr:DMT family transporter [Candidatus Bathyarchaeota archaeon]